MKAPETINEIIAALKGAYPEARCALDYEKDYQLLFSARLSAQCTDARVNIVAKTLYEKYPTLEAFASADSGELEGIIRSCGLFRTKARDIIASAQLLISRHGGKVPGTMEELLQLPGVGRKIANLIMGDVFNQPAVVTDTHCIRLSNRLGLASGTDPYKVELALRQQIPPEEQSDFCHRLVHHGRAVCSARKPKCEQCVLALYCDEFSGKSSTAHEDRQAV